MEVFSSFGGKRFYGPPPCLLATNIKYFWVFLSYFLVPLVLKSVLNLFQNLAMVMRQRQSTLMAKLADISRLDKLL